MTASDTQQQHHYFATCAFGWATADTREAALEKCAKQFSHDIARITSKVQKDGEPGFYMWSCKVHAPGTASYGIEFYQPVDVTCSRSCESFVVYATQKVRKIWTNKTSMHLEEFTRSPMR